MYCVIQEIENKKLDPYGAYKKLKVDSTTITIDGETTTRYYYAYDGGRFERPIRKAYKISIHESYRQDGKVKKKQCVICTMGYYDILDSWPGDCILQSKLNEKLQEMKITEDELWNMVYKKLDPLIEKIATEFKKTEEYRRVQEHEKILKEYNKSKNEFESKYGQDTYDYCYDVFGVLRNKEMLNNIKSQHKSNEGYQRSYYGNSNSNYNDYDFSSYFKTNSNTYTEEEKEILKTIYKASAMKLHPDKTNDNGEGMKFLNKLKEEWGI